MAGRSSSRTPRTSRRSAPPNSATWPGSNRNSPNGLQDRRLKRRPCQQPQQMVCRYRRDAGPQGERPDDRARTSVAGENRGSGKSLSIVPRLNTILLDGISRPARSDNSGKADSLPVRYFGTAPMQSNDFISSASYERASSSHSVRRSDVCRLRKVEIFGFPVLLFRPHNSRSDKFQKCY